LPDGGTGVELGWNGNPVGGAAAFTPSQNCIVSTVILGLTNYVEGDFISVSILNDYQQSTCPTNEPGDGVMDFETPPPNDGSAAAFTFTNIGYIGFNGNFYTNPPQSVVLQANQKYWLLVSGTSTLDGAPGSGPVWEGGGPPTGEAAYDGAELWDDDIFNCGWPEPAFVIFGYPAPPLLSISYLGNDVILMWPTNAAGFGLQSTTILSPPTVWSTVPNEPVIVNGQNVVTNAVNGTQMFYRLSQ
jgi:hypothetical protein